jgi:hypothetical protein
MDVFSSSDELTVLLHIQLSSFLGRRRPMEDGLGATRSAKGPVSTISATTYLDDGPGMLWSEKLDIVSSVSGKERHAG